MVIWSHFLNTVQRNTRSGSACRSNFQPRKWLKPIDRYLHLNRFYQRSASLVISDRGTLNFDLHQALSSGAFHWGCSRGLCRFSCSGTCVTTTSLPPSFLWLGFSQVRSTCFPKPVEPSPRWGSHLGSTCQPSWPLQGWSMAGGFPPWDLPWRCPASGATEA